MGHYHKRFEYIPRNHPAYLPLHYVLFYPFGNPGYHWSIPLQNQRVRGNINQDGEELEGGNSSCVSARQFFRYHLFTRQDPDTLTTRFNPLMHGEKLFQQICCDMYACVDDNILNWHRINQSTVRSDLYSGVMDALQSDRADQIGDPVILAASYVGGDRFIARCYQVRFILLEIYPKQDFGECVANNINLAKHAFLRTRMLLFRHVLIVLSECYGNCTGVGKSIDVCHIHGQP
jgi:hypothetical protein